MKTLALCAFVFFAGCYKESVTPVKIPPPIDTTAVIIDTPLIVPICYTRIIYFGNSITSGVGASSIDKRWTTLVSNKLLATEDNRGVSGSTLETNPLQANMMKLLPTVPAKEDSLSLLVISYGINDVLTSRYSASSFLSTYDSVMTYITTIKKWPAAKVLLIAPNWFVGCNEQRLLAFIDAVKKTSDKYHTLYVEPYQQMKGKKELFPDAIHPNDSGHAELADIIYNAIPK